MVPFPENGCLEYLPAFLLGPLHISMGKIAVTLQGGILHPTNPPKPCEILTFWIPKSFGTGPFGMGPNPNLMFRGRKLTKSWDDPSSELIFEFASLRFGGDNSMVQDQLVNVPLGFFLGRGI